MAYAKAPHHKGTHDSRSRQVRAAAYANPNTQCWRCHRTLDEIRATKPKAKWTAGHLNAGEINGRLLAECSPCNFAHGARLSHRNRKAKTTRRTALTW